MSYFEEKELMEKRGRIIDKQEKLLQTASDEGRELNQEEQSSFDKMEAEYGRLTNQIENTRKLREKKDALEDRAQIQSPGKSVDEVVDTEKQKTNAFRKYIAFGPEEMTSEERKIVAEMRAQSTTDSAGGYTIPEGFSNEIESGLLAYGGMLEVARRFPTATGNDLPWPTEDNTSQKGEILSENEQVNEQDLTFSSVTLNAYMYSSKLIRVSLQLLQDSAFNMESFIAGKMSERIGRILNEHYTTGTGSGQPRGVVTASSEGKETDSATAFTFQEVIDLKHSVDPAYRGNGRYMFSDNTLAAIKKLSVGSSDARPLWQPSYVVGEPDRVDGSPYTINQDVADSGTASNKFMLYGDFSKYINRDVLGFQLMVLRERYADYHQVGIIGFSRFDGDLIDAGAGAVKHMIHAAS